MRNKPRLKPGLSVFLNAFFELEHDRQWIVGDKAIPQPIPWRVINDYAQAFNFAGDLHEELVFFVRHLDEAYIKKVAKK
jgi:hypothetical protein